jgi:NAD+ synthase
MHPRKVIAHIVDWLNTYLENSGLTGFCVGVSGGIDSAVTATLCAQTGHPVMVLNMPICQAPDQLSRASAHNAWLKSNYPNVTPKDLDLTPVFSSIQDHFPSDIQDGLTMANTRSRLRMLALYAFAGHHRLLVAGTGNKVEDFGVGFFTKYGDGGVDISPIADLMKSEVYALGRVPWELPRRSSRRRPRTGCGRITAPTKARSGPAMMSWNGPWPMNLCRKKKRKPGC